MSDAAPESGKYIKWDGMRVLALSRFIARDYTAVYYNSPNKTDICRGWAKALGISEQDPTGSKTKHHVATLLTKYNTIQRCLVEQSIEENDGEKFENLVFEHNLTPDVYRILARGLRQDNNDNNDCNHNSNIQINSNKPAMPRIPVENGQNKEQAANAPKPRIETKSKSNSERENKPLTNKGKRKREPSISSSSSSSNSTETSDESPEKSKEDEAVLVQYYLRHQEIDLYRTKIQFLKAGGTLPEHFQVEKEKLMHEDKLQKEKLIYDDIKHQRECELKKKELDYKLEELAIRKLETETQLKYLSMPFADAEKFSHIFAQRK